MANYWRHIVPLNAFIGLAITVAAILAPRTASAETAEKTFVHVMTPLTGRWTCAGIDDATGRPFHLTEQNAFELKNSWFRSHEVDDRGVTNDVLTSFRSGGGKWRSLLINDDGTFAVFTYDKAPVPASWATASLSTSAKTQRFWLKHAFVNPNEFYYDIRVMDRGRLTRLEHGTCNTAQRHPRANQRGSRPATLMRKH